MTHVASGVGQAACNRVLRGGCFNNNVMNLRAAQHNNNDPTIHNGFRRAKTGGMTCSPGRGGGTGRDWVTWD